MEKTTFYKGDQSINITPEEAVTFQGGVAGDEFKGLLASGWSMTAPAPATPPPPPPPTPEVPKTPTETEQAGADENQALRDQIIFQTSQYEKLNSEFENYTADIAEIDSENVPMIQSIKDTFARRIEEMKVTNKAMEGQTAISGLRGMARYAPQTQKGFVSNEITNGMNRISELESQKLTAIQEAKRALKSDAKDRWEVFNNFMNSATKAYENKVQAVKDLHTALKDDEDRTRLLAKADLDLQTQVREEAEATAENIAGSLYSSLGDNVEDNIQYITDKANEYGIDPNLLIGTIQAYAQDEEDNQLEITSKLLTMGAKITEGQTMEVAPGIFVTGTKSKEQVWVESIVGNQKYKDLYVKENGEYVKKQRIDMGQAYKATGGGGGGTKSSVEGFEGTDWDYARELISLNPDADDEELLLTLREQTKLSDSDINTIVENRDVYTKDDSEYNLEEIATTLYNDMSKSEALQEIEDYDMNDTEREKLKELYMSKRSFWKNDPN